MKILVTGAAGFLGSHLCDSLLDQNHDVIGVDNFFRGKRKNLPIHNNFKFYECDLKDLNTLKRIVLLFKPEIVIHYAAINGTRYFYDIPYKVCNDNILITQNLLSVCNKVKKIVYASSSEIYGPSPVVPTNELEPMILHPNADRDSYASSKGIGEFLIKLWAKENNKKFLIIRPFNTYGPRMATNGYGQVIPEFIERIQSDKEFYLYGNGNQTRSFCYVKDHANIVSKIIEKVDNEILNIGFDEEITILKLAENIHDIMKKDFSNVTFRDAWKNDTKWRKPDLVKLKKYIGNYNFTSLKEGLVKTIKYYE